MLLAKRDYSERLEDLGPLGYAHSGCAMRFTSPAAANWSTRSRSTWLTPRRSEASAAGRLRLRASGVKPLLSTTMQSIPGLRQEEDPDKQASRAGGQRPPAPKIAGGVLAATGVACGAAVLTFWRASRPMRLPADTTSAAQSPLTWMAAWSQPAFRPALLGGLGAGRRINRAGGR